MKTGQSSQPEKEPAAAHLASLEEIQQAVHLAEETMQLLNSDLFRLMLERGEIVVEKKLDSAGNIKTLAVKDKGGQLFLFEDVGWFDRKLSERKRKADERTLSDREMTQKEALRAAQTSGIKTIEVKPETDPQKIN